VARCSFTAVSYVQVLQFFCPTVLSISRLPLLLLQVCVALKVLAAGNSFQDVATFSGMSVKATRLQIPPVPGTNFSSPHTERATKVFLAKVPDRKLPKEETF